MERSMSVNAPWEIIAESLLNRG